MTTPKRKPAGKHGDRDKPGKTPSRRPTPPRPARRDHDHGHDDEVNVNIHVDDDDHDRCISEVIALLNKRFDKLERKQNMANADIKRIAKAIERLEAGEVKEDEDAAAYRTEKEAKIAELTAQIAALEAQPKLDDEDQATLVALRERLEAQSPPPVEPEPEPTPTPDDENLDVEEVEPEPTPEPPTA